MRQFISSGCLLPTGKEGEACSTGEGCAASEMDLQGPTPWLRNKYVCSQNAVYSANLVSLDADKTIWTAGVSQPTSAYTVVPFNTLHTGRYFFFNFFFLKKRLCYFLNRLRAGLIGDSAVWIGRPKGAGHCCGWGDHLPVT